MLCTPAASVVVSPVVTVGWAQPTALSAMAMQLPDSLAMISGQPSMQASLTPTEPVSASCNLGLRINAKRCAVLTDASRAGLAVRGSVLCDFSHVDCITV
jgi:hypothetical protein